MHSSIPFQHPPLLSTFLSDDTHKLIKRGLSRKTSPGLVLYLSWGAGDSLWRQGRPVFAFHLSRKTIAPLVLYLQWGVGDSLWRQGRPVIAFHLSRKTIAPLVLYLHWGVGDSLWRQGRPVFALFSTFREGRGILIGGKDDTPSPCSLPSVRGREFSLAERTTSLRLVLYLPWGAGDSLWRQWRPDFALFSTFLWAGGGFSLATGKTSLRLVLYFPRGAGDSLWRQGRPVFTLFSSSREERKIRFGSKDDLSSLCLVLHLPWETGDSLWPAPFSLSSVRSGGFSLAAARTTSLRLVHYLQWGTGDSLWRQGRPAFALFSTFLEGRGVLFGSKNDYPSPCNLPSVRGGGFSLAARTTSLCLVLYLLWGAGDSLWPQGRPVFTLFSIFREGRGILFGGKDDQPYLVLYLPWGAGDSLWKQGRSAFALFSTFCEGLGILFGSKDDQSSPCSLLSVRGGGFSLAARTTSIHIVLFLSWGSEDSLW